MFFNVICIFCVDGIKGLVVCEGDLKFKVFEGGYCGGEIF